MQLHFVPAALIEAKQPKTLVTSEGYDVWTERLQDWREKCGIYWTGKRRNWIESGGGGGGGCRTIELLSVALKSSRVV
jgi:hypothetical protein